MNDFDKYAKKRARLKVKAENAQRKFQETGNFKDKQKATYKWELYNAFKESSKPNKKK